MFTKLFLYSIIVFHGNFSGNYQYQDRQYFYQVQPDENRNGKWRLLVKLIKNKENYTIYNTSIHLKENGGRLEQVKILGATQKSYIWSVLTSDFWKANFEASGKVSYEKSGNLMQNPQKVNPKDQFLSFDSKLSTEELAKKAIEQFIREYHTLFSFPEKVQKIENTHDFKVGNYKTQFTADFYQKDDHNLKIRNEKESLVYETLVRKSTENKKITIKIHYSKLQNWAWAVYESDFVEYGFDLEKEIMSVQKNGGVMPSPVLVSQKLDKNLTENDCMRLAFEFFVKDYERFFIKE